MASDPKHLEQYVLKDVDASDNLAELSERRCRFQFCGGCWEGETEAWKKAFIDSYKPY
jgi:hypothetical protein